MEKQTSAAASSPPGVDGVPLQRRDIPPRHRPLFPGESLRRGDKWINDEQTQWNNIAEERRGEVIAASTEENGYLRYCRPTHPLARNWYVDPREGRGDDERATGSATEPFASLEGARRRIEAAASSEFRAPHGVIYDVRGTALFAYDLGEIGAEHAPAESEDELDTAAQIGQSLYDRLTDHLQPRKAGSAWTFLTSKLGLFHPPQDGGRLLDDLRNNHNDNELAQVGLVNHLPGGEIVLTRALTDVENTLLLVRDLETDTPVDVLTQQGPLSGGLGIFAGLDRCESVLLDADDGPLFFAAFSLEDVAVLRACGIPTTSTDGLDRLSPDDVERLGDIFRVEKQCAPHDFVEDDDDVDGNEDLDPIRAFARKLTGSSSSREEEMGNRPRSTVRRTLVMVGWKPATLSSEIPESLNPVADYFKQLREYMGVEASDVRVWRPDEAEVKQFKFFALNSDAARLRKAMLASINNGLRDLSAYSTRHAPDSELEATLPEALTALFRGARDQGRSMYAIDDLQKAWKQVDEAFDAQLFEPMIEDALRAANPCERQLRMTSATTGRLANMCAVHLAAQMSIAIRRNGIDSLDPLPQDGIKNVLALGKQVINLHQEIAQCQNSTRILPTESIPHGKPPLALPASD